MRATTSAAVCLLVLFASAFVTAADQSVTGQNELDESFQELAMAGAAIQNPKVEYGQCNPQDEISNRYGTVVAVLIVIGAGLLLLGRDMHQPLRGLLVVTGVLFLLVTLLYSWYAMEINSATLHFNKPGTDHDHADFQVMVNNQLVDFTSDRYLSYKGQERSLYVHLHDPNNVVHKHAAGVTWAYFFKTLGVPLDDACITVHGEAVCNATFMINGKTVDTLNVEINDGDRALFHYGEGSASQYFDRVVKNDSCLYSGTCPERGVLSGCGKITAATAAP